jgi:Leucine-rich repeat (LRR) protein
MIYTFSDTLIETAFISLSYDDNSHRKRRDLPSSVQDSSSQSTTIQLLANMLIYIHIAADKKVNAM